MRIAHCAAVFFAVISLIQQPGLAADPGPQIPPIVFVSRNAIAEAPPGSLPGFGPQHRTALVGGKLMVRERSGKLRVLVDSTRLIDVADPCVSWDGKRVLFSGIVHPDSNWRIFEIGVDGKNFRQLTFSDRVLDLSQFGASAPLFQRYDDFDPCYLPNGKIAFASTRYPSLAMVERVRTSNIYVMEADGKNLRRITSERNGGEEPTVDPVTGRIVYARWWANIDRPSNVTRNNLSREDATALTSDIGNIWHAVAINPDGDALKLYAGFVRTRYGTQTYKPAVMRDGRLLSTFSPRTWLVPSGGGTGIRWFRAGADYEHHIIGVRSEESLRGLPHAPPPYATDPTELDARTILFSYAHDGKDYGIFSCTLDGKNLRRVVDLPGTLELEPQVVAARRRPPVVIEQFVTPVSDLPPTEDPETYARNDFFRFDCMNIFINGKVDEPMPDAPRIGQDLTIQFFMNPQRQSSDRPDPSILLKTAPVFYMGGIHEHDVPAEVPLFEQIIDKNGKVWETTDGKFAHVAGFNFERVGSGTKCAGCHIGHSMLEVPKNGEIAEWFNAAPSASVTASSTLSAGNDRLFAARNVVDRQARVGGDSVVWAAGQENEPWVELRWPIPIEVREFVLYNIPHRPSEGTRLNVHSCKILLYYHGTEVAALPVAGPLKVSGTSISVLPTTIDAARITITKFSGNIKHRSVAGLAEVETIARLLPISP
jgi:hypothetical protein